MQAYSKKWIFYICVIILAIACVNIGYDYATEALDKTNRNELYSPNEYNVAVTSPEGYSKIYENKNFEYYYSSQKTILKILNKKSGFVWSTGADTELQADAEKRCSGIAKYSDEYYSCAIDAGPRKDGKLTAINYAQINGLIYFTLLNGSAGTDIWTMTENTSAVLLGHQNYANEWMFKFSYNVLKTSASNQRLAAAVEDSVNTSETPSEDSDSGTTTEDPLVPDSDIEIKINMRLTFTEDGLDVNIYDEDVYGQSRDLVDSIYPLPLLGQSGGKLLKCKIDSVDENGVGDCSFSSENGVFDNPKTNLDGYIFVPDGSGALIRFDNVKYYETSSAMFYFDMYGDPYKIKHTDYEFMDANYTYELDMVPKKQISMPVWGVAYGNQQDAFVGYVTRGSEYFGLLYKGRTNDVEYASISPRFERNRKYIYRYSGVLSNYQLTADEVNTYFAYDIGLSYKFLQGDGSDGELPASYVGMALKYRQYLEENNLVKNDVQLRYGPKVDFLMSDAKEGIFGYSEVDVTSTSDVKRILNELHNDGIEDITSTLYGWQKGGNSASKPWESKFSNNLGGKAGFKDVVNTANDLNYHIDFYTQFAMINNAQSSSFNAYVVKGLSRDYGGYILFDNAKPMTWWYYTNADRYGQWLNDQADVIAELGPNAGLATGGITTLLIPDYGKKLSYAAAANSVYQSTKEAASKLPLSGDTPNSYLWKNYSDFTNISVYNTQYQCETDSVPFMEIVFSGLVNLYAEYSNFSFYDKISQLKMIEYNLLPSFIISANEVADIMYTNSRDWFATSYNSFHSVINEINDNVMKFTKAVAGKTIVGRDVVELTDNELGLYINTYATFKDGEIGNDKTYVAINYLDHPVDYVLNGKTYTIPAMQAMQLD